MMRPTLSPLNALIYQAPETNLAPVEDLVLSRDDFASLCADGILRPHARHLTLKPHVRWWSPSSPSTAPRASGHLEIEGFLPHCILRLSGGRIDLPESASDETRKQLVTEWFERRLVDILRTRFPECQLTVSPATELRPA